MMFKKDLQFYKFCAYGFLKNLRFFEPFLILFFLEKGLTYFEIGSLYAIREIVTNIAEIPSGIIADAVGRRKAMVFSFCSYILSFVIFFMAKDYLFFALAMVFFSLGHAFRSGTHKAMIFEYLKIKGWEAHKSHYYGFTRSSSQIGSAVSSLIGALIVFYSGSFKYIFLFSTLPYFMDLILVISYPGELDGYVESKARVKKIHLIKTTINSFLSALKQKEVQKSVANLSFYTGLYKACKDYIQPILHGFVLTVPLFLTLGEKQRTSIVIGIFYFLVYLLTSYASANSGRVSEKFKTAGWFLNVTLLAGYMIGLLSGLFLIWGIPLITLLMYMGIYILQNLRKPVGIAYLTDRVEHRILATALSAESQLSALITALIAMIVGFLADAWGIGWALVLVVVLLLISFPASFLTRRE